MKLEIEIFIVFGIISSVSIGAFISLIVVSSIKNKIIKWLAGIILSLTIGFGLTGFIICGQVNENKMWNNGECSKCHTKFEIFEIEYIKNTGEVYYYKCENNHIIKMHNIKN